MGFHWYGLIIGLAVLVAFEMSKRLAVKRGVDVLMIDGVFWWVVIFGIVGARLYHVIDYWDSYYQANPVRIAFFWEGGLGIWGAIIGGGVGLAIYLYGLPRRQSHLAMTKYLDIACVGLPLGQAIGRVGNWVNGEIVGKNGEPLFAYEAVANLVLFLGLWFVVAKKKTNGKIAGWYFVGYGLIRIVLEGMRPEAIIWRWLGVPVASLISFSAILTGLYLVKGRQK